MTDEGFSVDGVLNKGMIGRGAFGVVYLVENDSQEQFAVKVMDVSGWDQKAMADNELKVLKKLNHQHVLAYVESFLRDGALYIITEYCKGGDLSGFLDAMEQGVPEDLLLVWLGQMACGLQYMHTNVPAILHRDLKPSNIYLTETGTIRLGDMGIARMVDEPASMVETFCGTPPYMSPEAISEKPYNAKTDVWSLGCCVVEMATLQRAYDGSSLILLRDIILLQKREPLPRGRYSRELDSLVGEMLKKEYTVRLSADQLLDKLEKGHFVGQLGHNIDTLEPFDLLDKHGLLGCLALYQDKSPGPHVGKSSVSNRSTTTTSTTLVDLSESMSNIRDIVGPQGTLKAKVEHRMKHRRPPSEDTVINSNNLKTVIYKPGEAAAKVPKKKLPNLGLKGVTDEPVQAQEMRPALSLTEITLLTTSLTSTLTTLKPSRNADTETQISRGTSMSSLSRADQVATLKEILTQFLGQSSMTQAIGLISSQMPSMDIMGTLRSLLDKASGGGDVHLPVMLSQFVIYLVLLDSVAATTA